MITDNKAEDRMIFALDIGTRSIIGVAGVVEGDKVHILAIESEEHAKRAMIDGQIEDIDKVAKLAGTVKERIEAKLGMTLKKVCIAAAGRALITQKASYELELSEPSVVDQELISRLEVGAISQAEKAFSEGEDAERNREFFLVGYSVLSYQLDHYEMSSLKDHKGKNLKAEVIATFLPSAVVDSLYTAMNKIGLEVASVTLEPIAAINAAIPQDIRLLNLALVDIGAGTSDIAICRDGGIAGYTMATVAGDEITETLMKQFLVDFGTAERMKSGVADTEEIVFTDILGFEQTVKREAVLEAAREPMQMLCREIGRQILEVNNGAPSAVFLAGGGSKMAGLRETVAEQLDMDIKRVAVAGNNFKMSAFSEEYDLNTPEYATPLGIIVSAGLNLINDSFRVTLNGRQAKLFKNGALRVMDILMMNGYGYQHMVGRSGQNIMVIVDGRRKMFYGERAIPAVLKLNGNDVKVTDIVHAGDIIEFEPAVSGEDAHALFSDALEGEADGALLNGVNAPADTPLQTGDVIVTGSGAESEFQEDENSRNLEMRMSGDEREHPAADLSAGRLSVTLNNKPVELEPKKSGGPYYLMDMLEYSGLDFDNISGNVVIKVNGNESTFLQELKNNDVIEIGAVKKKED